MKAKFICEALDFERGRDPKSAIGVGLFGNMPNIGRIQADPFDLFAISKTICNVYNFPIKNYTPIDEKSNYNWDKGYQNQYVTMNLNIDSVLFEKFMGPKYYDQIKTLMGKDYIPPMKLGISSSQKHWISKNGGGYEFSGNSLYVFIDAGGYFLTIDFAKVKNISEWISDNIKDNHFMKQVIWDLRYKPPISLQKTPRGRYMNDRQDVKIDVKEFCKKYGQKELENLMKGNYRWDKSVSSWKITNGILEFVN